LIGYVAIYSVAGSIFTNSLGHQLKNIGNLSSQDISSIESSINYVYSLPQAQQAVVVKAYADSINPVFLIGVVTGGMAVFCSLYASISFVVFHYTFVLTVILFLVGHWVVFRLVKNHNLKTLGAAEPASEDSTTPSAATASEMAA
jgi:large-conductance mechanosensitive channel